MNDLEFDRGYRPGLLGEITKLHLDYFGPAWNLGVVFEAKVAGDLAEFLPRFDPNRDFLLTVRRNGLLCASLVVDGIGAGCEGAQLRWFVTHDRVRGTGLGKRMLAEALGFCDQRAYRKIFLTTFKGLDAARALYERQGFVLSDETEADPWGGTVGLQRFDRMLPIAA